MPLRRLAPTLPIALALLLVGAPASAQRARRSAVRSEVARRARAKDSRIETYREKYLERARRNRPRPKKMRRERKLTNRAAKLRTRLAESKDRRPILVIFEGPDGAGKSSTIRRVRKAFEGEFKVKDVHFGAPPEGETRHWLEHYKEQLPGDGEVALWDRSYYGRTVYDPYYDDTKKSTTRTRQKEIRELEGSLQKDYRVVKIFLDARGKRLAKTIGKREAQAPEKLSESDYRGFLDRKKIRKLFEDTIERTSDPIPWHVVKANKRYDVRKEIFDILEESL